MSVALATTGDMGPVRRAIKAESKPFDGVIQVLCVKTADGSWVQFDAIVDVVGADAVSQLRYKRVPIAVDLAGKAVIEMFVGRGDFYGAAIISERNKPFRSFVIEILERLDDKGAAFAPDLMGDPRMQLVAALAESTAAAIRAEREASEAKGLAIEAREIGLSADEKATRALKAAAVAQGEAGSFMLVPWASTRGIELDPGGDGNAEGRLLSDQMRKMGLIPRKIRTERYVDGVNVYPEEWLLRWERHYLKRHPEVARRLGRS